MQQWMDDNKVLYTRIPPHNPACEAVFKEGIPSITAPKSGGEYFISSKEATPLQLRCEVSNDVGKVFWYINNQFYKSATPGTAVFFTPLEGPVKISCTDDKGRNRDIWITVKKVDF
jgi:penicillin-binding protein 1C